MTVWDCKCGARNFRRFLVCYKCDTQQPKLTIDEKLAKMETLRHEITQLESLSGKLRSEYLELTGREFQI